MKNINIKFRDKDFRGDLDRYFQLSGVLESSKLKHSPFIVFDKSGWSLIEIKEEIERLSGCIAPEEVKKLKSQLKKQEDCDCLVVLVDNKNDLLLYPDETEVMGQWKGQWSSDFFNFKVGDMRNYINNKLK